MWSRRVPGEGAPSRRRLLPLQALPANHGHFAAYSACARGDLELVEDRELRWYEIDGARYGFCGHCGARLFWSRRERPTISIAAGTLDEPTWLHATHHIFTADAGDYYEITDELERRLAR